MSIKAIKITIQDRANTTAERWKLTYCDREGNWHYSSIYDKEKLYNSLLALGANPSPKDIEAIVGNSSWTRLECDCCKKEVPFIISFPALASEEYGNTELCEKCIRALVTTLES